MEKVLPVQCTHMKFEKNCEQKWLNIIDNLGVKPLRRVIKAYFTSVFDEREKEVKFWS